MKKQPKIKQYEIMVSVTFPTTHPSKGQETDFVRKILIDDKIHTVRPKFDEWKRKSIEIQEGRAVAVLKYWGGRPYGKGVKKIPFLILNHIHVQKVHVYHIKRTGALYRDNLPPKTKIFIDNSIQPLRWPFKFAARDGLTMPDFLGWFKKPVEDAALIQFTNFKY